MKKIILIIFTTIIIISFASAQDLIIKRNGDTLNVKITKSTPETVEFYYPNEELINIEYKNAIEKIIYSSGRKEICSQKTQLQQINGPDDWEKVIITYSENDVKGLTRVAQITKTSGWGGTLATGIGYEDALKKIKKEAAEQGASIVLIIDKPNEQTTQYGAGVSLTGIAYK